MRIDLDYKWDKNEFQKASHANFPRRRRTLILFLAIYQFLLRWPLQRSFLARQFEKHAEKDADIQWAISHEGFKGGGAGSQGEFARDAVTSVERSKDEVLIYRYPIFHWLPMSELQSRDDIERFESVARQKSRKYVAG